MMRLAARALAVLLFVGLGSSTQAALAQAPACTGLCLQQVSCPAGTTTTITGKVYTPNGVDPLPDVLVYIPNAPVDAFAAGVQCPVIGAPPSGSPIVGATTAVDGSFKLTNVPVGPGIPIVIQTGRWRRQVTVDVTASCADTPFDIRMPRNKTEGDIPKIAVATGSADSVECVLRKVGLDDSEFTDVNGTGRINLFSGTSSPGAKAGQSSSTASDLLANKNTLNSYDVLMLPCEGGQYTQPADQLKNVLDFANAGGRIYSSHFEYVWMYQNDAFAKVVNWAPNQAQLADGVATVDTSFYEGSTLAEWLQIVGATTTKGQMPISTLRHDLNGVIAPTQSWLRLNNASAGNPVMQFVFDAPVGATQNQCGRVLFNEYHVENSSAAVSRGVAFPAECTAGQMTPQEKLLEYSLFELTSDGGAATLSPTSADFGSQPLGYPTASKSFTWTNNSTFSSTVTLLKTTGDFAVTGNNCTGVPASGSCTITVNFTPTVLGPGTGVLTVGSSGSTLTATLSGIGTPVLVATGGSTIDFGSADVGFTVSKSITLTNSAAQTVPLVTPSTTGDFSVSSNCGATLASGASCTLVITFKPTVNGPRTGSMTVAPVGAPFAGVTVALTGNGVDFTLANDPSSGSVIAGHLITMHATAKALSGFNATVVFSCSTDAPGATCSMSPDTGLLNGGLVSEATITTTSHYKVVGFGGLGGSDLWVFAFGAGGLLFVMRRRTGALVRGTLALILLAFGSMTITGCSGKLPSENVGYTPTGTYTVTVKATDGMIVHTASYSMKVTVN